MSPTILSVVLFAVAMPLVAQTLPGGVNLDNPATIDTKSACVAECEAVYSDCRTECENPAVRAHDRRLGLPDAPLSQCLEGCNNGKSMCVGDC